MILTIIVLSGIAFLLMYYFTDFGLRKSLIISCGAGAAMIIVDMLTWMLQGEDDEDVYFNF